MKHKYCYFAMWIFLIPFFSIASVLTSDLEKILVDFHQENQSAPGVSVFVECPSLKLKWSSAKGTIAHDNEEPFSVLHTFRIASNTKTYTASAILRLVENGILKLDDTLDMYLSGAHQKLLLDDGYDLGKMTIQQLLSHTSGLNEHCHDDRFVNAIMEDTQKLWTRDEQIRLCVEWEDPLGKPGEKYQYSDTGYVILGGIIEQVTKQNLGNAVHELLNYQKLRLKSTYWEYMEEPASNTKRAHQYLGEKDVSNYNASYDLFGGGGIVTDTVELGSFMRHLLIGNVLHDESTLKKMMEEGTKSYRLGLMCVELDGNKAWGHQGFWNTFAYYIPSLDITVSGCVLDHYAANGRLLADRIVARVSQEFGKVAAGKRERVKQGQD